MKRALLLIPIAWLIGFTYAPWATRTMGVSGPNPLDLPNDCGIVATEAASRLSATGSWTRIVQIRLVRDGKTTGHSIVVWQPPTARHIWAYDEFLLDGSFDTGVVLRDPQKDLPAVMKSIAEVSHRELLAAWYCK